MIQSCTTNMGYTATAELSLGHQTFPILHPQISTGKFCAEIRELHHWIVHLFVNKDSCYLSLWHSLQHGINCLLGYNDGKLLQWFISINKEVILNCVRQLYLVIHCWQAAAVQLAFTLAPKSTSQLKFTITQSSLVVRKSRMT